MSKNRMLADEDGADGDRVDEDDVLREVLGCYRLEE